MKANAQEKKVNQTKRIRKSYYYYQSHLITVLGTKQQAMATGTSSQSQPSYLHTIEEKPNFQAISPNQLLDQSSASAAMTRLASSMALQQGQKFEECLNSLNILFEKGYSYLFLTHTLLMRKLMNHFTKLGKQLQDDIEDSKKQFKMLFLLSVIAQLLRNNPKFYYPFTRKFLLTVFSIDVQLLQNLSIRKQILAILAVIYENLSRQPKLISKYALETDLKMAVLGNYKLIEEVFTLKIMNKVISNMVSKGVNFSVADYHKYQVMDTTSRIIAQNQMDLFLIKMKMTMISLNVKRKPHGHHEVMQANLVGKF